jgi:hypothetical protein
VLAAFVLNVAILPRSMNLACVACAVTYCDRRLDKRHTSRVNVVQSAFGRDFKSVLATPRIV